MVITYIACSQTKKRGWMLRSVFNKNFFKFLIFITLCVKWKILAYEKIVFKPFTNISRKFVNPRGHTLQRSTHFKKITGSTKLRLFNISEGYQVWQNVKKPHLCWPFGKSCIKCHTCQTLVNMSQYNMPIPSHYVETKALWKKLTYEIVFLRNVNYDVMM